MSNILSEVHPELVAEWSDKNLPLTPDRITYGSNKVVWWKGACGHEWQTSVKARSNGENCPICSGARVIEGVNDLATLKPELADEYTSSFGMGLREEQRYFPKQNIKEFNAECMVEVFARTLVEGKNFRKSD